MKVREVATALYSAYQGSRRIERIACIIAAVLCAGGLVHVAILITTGQSWSGPVSLRKPATFGLSFGLTLASVAWASSFIRMAASVRTVLLGLLSAACVLETSLVTLQAWRRKPSHFNFETPFDSSVAMTLAGGGAVIIAIMIGFTVAALRPASAETTSMRFALRFGFLTLLGALAVGAAMIADGVTRARSGDVTGAYTAAGGLKPLHAVAMHAILLLPGLAWLLGFTGWDESRRTRTTRIAALVYLGLIAVAAAISIW